MLRIIICCLLSFIAAPALASEADFEKLMAHGVADLNAGNPDLALESFRKALAEHPDDPEAVLYLAISLNRANDPAAEAALKRALRQDPNNSRINLELGTLYYNKQMFEESADYFDNLLALKPEAEIQEAAEQYLAAIRSRSDGKRWSLNAAAGMQYDSNAPMVSAGGPLPTGVTRRGDFRGVFNLGFDGTGYRDSKQELSGSYSIYQTLNLHLADFNLTQNRFDITYRRNVSSLFSVKISGDAESVLMGGTLFNNGFSVAPGLSAALLEGLTADIEYRFSDSIFHNSEIFPTNAQRNGLASLVKLMFRQRVTDSLIVRLGCSYERDVATVSAWSSTAIGENAGVAVALPFSLLLDLSVDAVTRRYDSILTGETANRADSTVTSVALLTWQFAKNNSVSAGYSYTNNNSNTDGYQYKRGIASIMVQGRY